MFCHVLLPLPYICKQLSVVLYIIKLLTGEVMRLRSAVLMRGMSKPPLVPSISNIAEALGAAPVLLMPMFWAKKSKVPNPKFKVRTAAMMIKFLILFFFFIYYFIFGFGLCVGGLLKHSTICLP